MAIVKQTLGITATAAIPSILTYSRSSSATKVNNIGRIELVAANQIRYDYDPTNVGSVMGWLLEESSSNTCLQSEDFATTWVTSNSTLTNLASVTANSTKSPDGTVTGDTLAAGSSATGIVAVRQQGLTFTNGTHYTVSVFAKKNTLEFLELSNNDDATAGMTCSQVFNLTTGATGASGGTVFASSIRQFPNGWYRCEVTFAATASSNTEVYIKARSDNAVSTTFAATSGQSLFIWGAQVEAKKYATSYIPTTTVAVTRAADVASIDNTEGSWNWDVGASFLIDATPLNTTEVVAPIYHYQDADNSDYVTHLSDGKVAVVETGSSQLDANPFATSFSSAKEVNFRSMLSMKTNRFHAAQNGSLSPNLPDTTSFTVPRNGASSEYTIKFFHGTGLPSGSGWLKQFRIYSNVVTDLDLQNLSFRTNDDAQNLALNAVQVLDGSISTLKLANDAVTNDKILDGTIIEASLANSSVTSDKIGDNAVTSQQIAANTITATEIADGAIGTAQLGVDVIVAEDIAANAITVSEIRDNAVTKPKIIDNAVDIAKLDVTDGTIGQVLKTDGAGSLGFTTIDIGGTAVGGDISGTVGNAQIKANTVGISELNVSEGTNGQYLTTNGAGTLSFTTDSTNVGGTAVGGDLTGTVSNAQIAGGAVGNAEIADDAVNTGQIADGAVETAQLEDLNVTTGKLADNSVTDTKLADHATLDANRAVGTNHIKNLNVTEGKIAAGAVTAGKLGPDAVALANLADNSVVSANIVNGTIVEADLADDAVTAAKLAANSVVSASIVDGTITDSDLANNSVTNLKIANLAVGGSKIANNAVVNSKIADNQVTIAKLDVTDGTSGQVLTTDGNGVMSFADDSTNVSATAVGGDVTGTVGNITIPDNTITSAMIGVDVIVAADLANNSITVAELSDNAVTTNKIINNAVTGAKIAMGSDASGDVLYYDGTDYVRLAKGTDGEVLTLASGLPSWDADSTNVGATVVGGDVSGTVSNIQISANAVGNSEIADNAVTGNKIALGSDTRGDVMFYNGTDYVRLAKGTTGQVLTQGANDPQWSADSTNVGTTAVGGDVTGTVSNIQIAADAVGNSEIAANAVDGTHIALGSDAAGDVMYYDGTNYVRLAKGTAGQVLKINSGATAPEWSADIDTTIGDAVVGGDVTGTISNITIPTNSITSAMIAPGVIVAQDIATNAVNGTHIAIGSDVAGDVLYYNGTDYTRLGAGTAGQVLTMNVGATAPEWAADSTNVGATAVGGDVTGTVSNITIPNNTITTAMIAADVIVAEDIANNAITVAELQDNAVATAKIQSNAVDGTKIAMGGDVAGDVLYYNGTDYVRLPKGTASQVLTMNAGATAPEWAADQTNVGSSNMGGMLGGTVGNASINAGVVTMTMLATTGTATGSKFLRDDGQWTTVSMTETDPTAVTMAIALG